MSCIWSILPVSNSVVYPVARPKREIRESDGEGNAGRITFSLSPTV